MIIRTPTPKLTDAQRTNLVRRYESARPMLIRIGSGIVGVLFYCFMVFWGNGLPFALGVALFSVWGTSELYLAVRGQGGMPSEFLGFMACIVFEYAAWTHSGARFAPYLPALLMLLVIVALLAELVKGHPRAILNIGSTLLGSVYVGWLFSYLTLLRGSEAGFLIPPIGGTTPGEWLVIFVTATTWLADSGALFVGRSVGRHKMAPNISPAKTWEGAAGGIVFSVLGGLILGWWLHLPLGHAFGLSLLCSLAGQIGDLSESALKRDLGVKDFGTVIPGHGGILDRIDSLLFSAPLAYYYILFFLIPRH